ncbi:MAG: hypothetical protein AAF492_30005, partial [Verrucomicrobiota bacterium]
VLIISSLFTAATETWSSGEAQVTLYNNGRGAIDQIYIDLTTAVADGTFPFATREGDFDAMYMISLVTHRASEASKLSDASEVAYFVEEDADGRGRLRRRRFSLSDSPSGTRGGGTCCYSENFLENGSRASAAGVWSAGFFNSFDSSAVLADNIYSFEVEAIIIDGNNNERVVDDFYSLEVGGNYSTNGYFPDRVDVEITSLSDEQWNRLDQLSGSVDQFVRKNGARFRVSATFPSRTRR